MHSFDERRPSAAWSSLLALPPLFPQPPCAAVRRLVYGGSPAWVALVPAAASCCPSLRSLQLVHQPGLYVGERAAGCTLALRFEDEGGCALRLQADAAPLAATLESKAGLAAACLAHGSSVCPASFIVPWSAERLPQPLADAFDAEQWVLKRDGTSNGEGVFFPRTSAAAEAVMASQRGESALSALSSAQRAATHFVAQRHVDGPLLLDGRKFSLRCFVLLRHDVPPLFWPRFEVRLAPSQYTGDTADRGQALTNFAPGRGAAEAAGVATKRCATEFSPALSHLDLDARVPLLLAETLRLAEPPSLGTDASAVEDEIGQAWAAHALLAVDVAVDASGRLWVLEVNRGPQAGVESVLSSPALSDSVPTVGGGDGTESESASADAFLVESRAYRDHAATLVAALICSAHPGLLKLGGSLSAGFALLFSPPPDAVPPPAWLGPSGAARHQLGVLLASGALPAPLQAALALAARAREPPPPSCGGKHLRNDAAVVACHASVSGGDSFASHVLRFRDASTGGTLLHLTSSAGLEHATAAVAALCPSLLSTPDGRGVTPLGRAARAGASSAGAALISAGCDVAMSVEADAAVHHAAATNAAALIASLAAAGLDVSDDLGFPSGAPLHWAAGEGAAAAVEALLLCGAPADALDSDGLTPLHLAIAGGHSASARLLIHAGADARVPFPGTRCTAMHAASHAGMADVVALLLKSPHGEWLATAIDEDGLTSEGVARECGDDRVLTLFPT